MEAAHIAWRPLGRLLVEQGLLTDEELELALAKQQTTGRRLGETIVECGFVSPPDLSNALAAQYGIQLTTETGFGTGLRAQIQLRHETYRGRPTLAGVPDLEEPSEEEASPEFADPQSPSPGEAILLAQLEEQWAKLAAAEEWLAEREVELGVLTAERDRRRAQAERLARRTWRARGEQAVERERRRSQVLRFMRRVRDRDGELERRDEELRRLGERSGGQVDQQRLVERERELAALAADRQRLADDVRGCDAEIEKLRRENARRRAQATRFVARLRDLRRRPVDDPVAIPPGHLVFVQLASGYSVVEREGPPPRVNTWLELPDLFDGRLVVAGSRRSPLPDDARPCVVAHPA